MINSVSGIHVEPTNLCTLKCPACARTKFIQQWPQHWKNNSLDIDSVMNFLDIDLDGKSIYLCGNYGDPIYHPDFINFVKKFKDRGATITITTNGSYQKLDWWQALADNLDSDDCVQFSVDGTPENFINYRINADWNSIEIGMNTMVQSQCKTAWKYLVFAYNQNDIESTRQLSQQIGIDEFKVKFSDRFDEQTDYLKPNQYMLGARYQSQQMWKKLRSLHQLDPKCANKKEHFISADGHYSPCCHLADHRFYYKTQFGKDKSTYDITKTTISQLLQHQDTVDFMQRLEQHPGCQFNCPRTQIDQ